MRGTKRGRLPRYIITIALYIYFHDPIFNTFSVSQSAWWTTLTAYSTRLLLRFFSWYTLWFCVSISVYLYTVSYEKSFPALLVKIDFPYPVTTELPSRLNLRVQTKTYSKFQSSSRVSPNIYFSLLLSNIIVPFWVLWHFNFIIHVTLLIIFFKITFFASSKSRVFQLYLNDFYKINYF